jgi:hypothetical protein
MRKPGHITHGLGYAYIDVTDPAPEEIAPELFGSLLEAMGDLTMAAAFDGSRREPRCRPSSTRS